MVLIWIMRIFRAADAESKIKISQLECQHSPNTEPKLIKNYQKLIVKKVFSSIGSCQLHKVFSLRIYYHIFLSSEPMKYSKYQQKCKNLQSKNLNLKIKSFKTYSSKEH